MLLVALISRYKKRTREKEKGEPSLKKIIEKKKKKENKGYEGCSRRFQKKKKE